MGLKLPLSKRKIALLLKNGKKSSFFEEFKTPSKNFSISEGPEKNLFAKKRGRSRKSWRMLIWPHFLSSAGRQLIFEYVGYFVLFINPKKFQISAMKATPSF